MKLRATDPDQEEHKIPQLVFAAGPCRLTLGRGYRLDGSGLSWHRSHSFTHTQIHRRVCLTAGSASHQNVPLGIYLGNMISSSAQLDEGSLNLYKHHSLRIFFSKHIARASFDTLFFHGQPPGQGMVRARGSCPSPVVSVSVPWSAPTSSHISP